MNDWLVREAEKLGVEIDREALGRLQKYQKLLISCNEQVNLTSITEPAAIYELHFLDSLSVSLAVDLRATGNLVDVGTGAGFPGLVLAAVFPHLRVTLVESVEKKANFLRLVSRELDLGTRVETVCLRAEEAGHKRGLRAGFDLAVARGVAKLNVLAEYCLPLVRPAGVFVALKGPKLTDELAEARLAFRVLGGTEAEVIEWVLPGGAGRTLVRIPKIDVTPSGYPRRVGLPAKRPLQ